MIVDAHTLAGANDPVTHTDGLDVGQVLLRPFTHAWVGVRGTV